MDLIKVAEQAFAAENPVEHPSFNTGDTVSVHYKIVEGNKERIQVFRGVVIQVKGTGSTKTFTVRKMSGKKRDLKDQVKNKKALRCRAFFISYLCQIFKEYFIVSTKTESSQQ
mgnify:CR=1 FL=1